MTAAQDATGDDMAAETARAKVADAGRKMVRYKAAIDAGGDLEEISTWISDAKAQRLAAEAELRRVTTRTRMTRQQIADLISEVSDLADRLRGAESEAAAETYRQLGLRLTYYPDKKVVRAAAAPQPDNIGKWLVSEGGIHPNPNACSLEISHLGAGYEPGRGPVDHCITTGCVALLALNAGTVPKHRSAMHGLGVPGLALSRLGIVASASSYGVPAHEAHNTEELEEFVRVGIPDRDHPSLSVSPPPGGQGWPGPIDRSCPTPRWAPNAGSTRRSHIGR